MRVDLFDFDLPEDRIALRPANPRDSARMLVVGVDGALADRHVRELPDWLRPGDALVVNDTRVIPARLNGVRVRGEAVARIEATLHKREGEDRWRAFVKPAKKLNVGERIRFGEASESMACLLGALDATVIEKGEGGEALLVFDFTGPALDEAIGRLGHMPLPPYIAGRRDEDARDEGDYQTLFADKPGAVAAPTAGLHFTPDLMERLTTRGVAVHRVTLHVGAGTFLPVKADDTSAHRMHSEYGVITEETASALNAARRAGGRIISVGTTSLRILESATTEDGVVQAFAGDTSIFITPGYRFRAVDVLLTNFHLPRSTLFMLVSAFSGLEAMRAAYAHAIAEKYRFYSYGDACLLFRRERAVIAGDVRVKALWRDDPTEAPLTIDLRIDAQGRIVGNWAAFGAVDLDGPACAPFVLRPDGAMEFAACADRRWRTDLRDHAMRVGEIFTVHWNERDLAAYKIVKVAVLGAKA